MHIDHTTIRTRQLEQTKHFLVRVFDLKVGTRPAIIEQNIPSYWLYAGDAPIIDIIGSSPYYKSNSPNVEAIDHTAFYLDDYDSFLTRLQHLNVSYSKMELEDIGKRRIFFTTSTGIVIEAVYRNK